jgi:hypothetical protein
VGATFIAMLQFALFTFLTTVGASIAVAVGGYLYGAILEHTAKVDDTRKRTARYSRLVSGFQDRLERRKSDAASSAAALFSAQRQEKQIRGRIRELETAGHRFVRLIGEEKLPSKQYEILAMNSSVSHQVKRGEKHPFYDSSWARPVPVHVWAGSLDEAKEKFETSFSKTVGFKLIHIQLASADAANRKQSAEDEAHEDASAEHAA